MNWCVGRIFSESSWGRVVHRILAVKSFYVNITCCCFFCFFLFIHKDFFRKTLIFQKYKNYMLCLHVGSLSELRKLSQKYRCLKDMEKCGSNLGTGH